MAIEQFFGVNIGTLIYSPSWATGPLCFQHHTWFDSDCAVSNFSGVIDAQSGARLDGFDCRQRPRIFSMATRDRRVCARRWTRQRRPRLAFLGGDFCYGLGNQLGTNSAPFDVSGSGSPPAAQSSISTQSRSAPPARRARKLIGPSPATPEISNCNHPRRNITTAYADNTTDVDLSADAPAVGQITLIDPDRIGVTISTYAGRVWISSGE
jgi:hypothetical protein